MEKTVLATLAYADAIGTPLTMQQVHTRLIEPKRLGNGQTPTLLQTKVILDELVQRSEVYEERGWYVHSEPSSNMFARRMNQANINAHKWKNMLAKAYWLQLVPFVQVLAASGSLAAGTTSQTSDWDMFVVAKRGRLYTARIFLLLISRFMGVLRTKSDSVAPDTFCFNHYVTQEGLEIPNRSLYVAYALTSLVPIFERDGCFKKLQEANGWVGSYLAGGMRETECIQRTVRPSRILAFVRGTIEFLLAWTIGDGLEAVLKWWQQRRIASDPATYERGGRVVANDYELEFHPRSAERISLLRYNEVIRSLGIPGMEADSGLL